MSDNPDYVQYETDTSDDYPAHKIEYNKWWHTPRHRRAPQNMHSLAQVDTQEQIYEMKQIRCIWNDLPIEQHIIDW